MKKNDYRTAIAEYIREEARPPDKYSHQPRLYELAKRLAEGQPFDDDVLYAAAWLHDLGVFIGHRPEEIDKLARWDNTRYAMEQAPGLLRAFGFPDEKVGQLVEVIRTHLPSAEPGSFEGVLMRDADILEQLGAVGILRIVSKVGRDTRFLTHREAVTALQRNLEELPGRLRLDASRREAEPRIGALRAFLDAVRAETGGVNL